MAKAVKKPTVDIEKAVNERLVSMLSVVDMSKIVTFRKETGQLLIGGVLASQAEVANLKAEADFFTESLLWKLIYETPKRLAEIAMFTDGENLATMQKGRSMLYTLSSQKNIVDLLKNSGKK